MNMELIKQNSNVNLTILEGEHTLGSGNFWEKLKGGLGIRSKL